MPASTSGDTTSTPLVPLGAGTTLDSMYPLDPVSPAEMEAAVRIFVASGKPQGKVAYSCAKLVEPKKEEYNRFKSGGPRPSRVVVISGVDETEDGGFEAYVNLSTGSLQECRRLPSDAIGGQAGMTSKDFTNVFKLVKKDPAWNEAIKKRGIDPATVEVDPWPGGGYVPGDLPKGHRAWRLVFFQKLGELDNCYARPIHGLVAYADVTAMKVHRLEDRGVSELPTTPYNFYTDALGPQRTDLKPIEVVQPEGPSFEVDGNHVKWAGWDFRIGTHPINGLVLHDVSFQNRPIFYRASLSDMVVPYGSRDPQHTWKHVLDGSEANILGVVTNPLKLGCDCLGEIHYFDVDYLNHKGEPVKVENGICMHEEDAGIQWKHTDARTNVSEVRRGRRLVVSSFSTVGNYDYGWYWHLHLDGEIELEVKLTGILSVGGVDPKTGEDPQFTPLVAPGIAAPLHQHLFSVRLDWNLDGGPCSLEESNIEAMPVSTENPDGSQFRVVSKVLETELAAQRDIAPEFNRSWKVVNRNSKNSLGKPVSYKILPGAAQRMFGQPNSAPGRRAAFGQHNLWATRFREGELMAAGENTVMALGGGGLPTYTKNNENIVDCDLVTWHTMGLTHVPRPEDWPVMPVEKARLNLIPVGFFDSNPVMDLPVGACHDHAHHEHGAQSKL